MLRRATITTVAVALAVLGALLIGFWVLLHPIETASCNTSLLDSTFKSALAPVHVAAAAVLCGCLWVLSAARRGSARPGQGTVWGVGVTGVYALACLLESDLFAPMGFVALFAGPLLGLPLLAVAGVQALRARRMPDAERWRCRARWGELVLWGAIVLGVPLSAAGAWMRGASPFCF